MSGVRVEDESATSLPAAQSDGILILNEGISESGVCKLLCSVVKHVMSAHSDTCRMALQTYADSLSCALMRGEAKPGEAEVLARFPGHNQHRGGTETF